jgi:transcriptional regulator with XRE-family HTH domain
LTGTELQALRKSLGCASQQEFAKALGGSQQSVSWAEKQDRLSEAYLRRLCGKLIRAFPDSSQQIMIRRVLDPTAVTDAGAVGLSRDAILRASRQEPLEQFPGEEMEPGSLPWAVDFRTRYLMDRLISLSEASGLSVQRLRQPHYGLVLRQGGNHSAGPGVDDILFPRPRQFGIREDTVVLLGSPFRHNVATLVLDAISKKLKVTFRFGPDQPPRERRAFFFGYPTKFNDLYVNGEPYRPNRYVDDTNAVCYEDYGLILHWPLGPLVTRGETPFGQEAVGVQRVVLVAGCHRLATGVGTRLLEDMDLRSLVLTGEGHDFARPGALLYKVLLRSGDSSTIKVKKIDWSAA